MKMEEVLYYLAGKFDKKPTALYTKDLFSFVDDMLSGTNIYDNSTNDGKICKEWINSIHIFITNIKNHKNNGN